MRHEILRNLLRNYIIHTFGPSRKRGLIPWKILEGQKKYFSCNTGELPETAWRIYPKCLELPKPVGTMQTERLYSKPYIYSMLKSVFMAFCLF